MASSAEDYLSGSFQFKIPPGASYVTDRRTMSYFTAGSNIDTSNGGTHVIRVKLTGDGWLDPGSTRLHYTLVNTDTNATSTLRTIGGPWRFFFRRVRCLVGGALVDDVDYYNRVHEMMHILSTNNNRDNDDAEGFGYPLG